MIRTFPPFLVALALPACGRSTDQSSPRAHLGRPQDEALGTAPQVAPPPLTLVPTPVEPVQDEAPSQAPALASAGEVASVEAHPPTTLQITVRPGENLVLLAGWAGTTAEAIASLNAISVTSPIVPGQSLEIPLVVDSGGESDLQDEVRLARENLERARERFAQTRWDRYLSRRGGLVGVITHQVETGETAWEIARFQARIPLWVLAAYNRDVDLDHLRIGEELVLPVLGDTLAGATGLTEVVVPGGGVEDLASSEAVSEGVEP